MLIYVLGLQFGGAQAALEALEKHAGEEGDGLSVAQLVRQAAGAAAQAAPRTGGGARASQQAAPQPAWEDEDDAEVEVAVAASSRLRKLRRSEDEAALAGGAYVERLRAEHARLNPRTGWAKQLASGRLAGGEAAADGDGDDRDAGKEEGDDGGNLLLRHAGALVRAPGGGAAAGLPLPAGELAATRVRDANGAAPSQSVVRSTAFHPSAALLLTAGLDKTLRLFRVDGQRNPLVQGVHLEDLPICKAAFSADGSLVVATGRRAHWYVYHLAEGRVERCAALAGCGDKSLESFVPPPPGAPGPGLVAFLGNDGCIPLAALSSRTCVGSLKMGGTARSGAFSADGQQLLTAGGDGVVVTWDLRMQRCLERSLDEGALSVSTVALSPSGQMLATGGAAGVVNLYQRRVPAPAPAAAAAAAPLPPLRPQPFRTLMNLTTTVDSLCFRRGGLCTLAASIEPRPPSALSALL